MAFVGQESIQRVQEPQIGKLDLDEVVELEAKVCPGRISGISKFVIISAKKTHEPNSFVIRQQFFPICPSPAFSAKLRSKIGAVSVKLFVFAF